MKAKAQWQLLTATGRDLGTYTAETGDDAIDQFHIRHGWDRAADLEELRKIFAGRVVCRGSVRAMAAVQERVDQ